MTAKSSEGLVLRLCLLHPYSLCCLVQLARLSDKGPWSILQGTINEALTGFSSGRITSLFTSLASYINKLKTARRIPGKE